MKNKILIFAPTYNESGNIIYLLKAIAKLNIKVDILIIDDNSPDNTQDKVIAYSKKRKNIKLIVRKKKDGIGTAHQVAFSYSLKKKYHFLITMDADLSHEPKVIPKILKELKIHPFVICSRYLKKSINEYKGIRLFLSFFGNKFIRFVLNINCTEYTSSFRGFNLKKIGKFNLKDNSFSGYSFFMESIYRLSLKGIYIKEIPFHFKDRLQGKSKIPRLEIFRTLINLFILKIRIN